MNLNRSKTIKVGNFRLKAFCVEGRWSCIVQEFHPRPNFPVGNSWADIFLSKRYVRREYALDAGLIWIKEQLDEKYAGAKE